MTPTRLSGIASAVSGTVKHAVWTVLAPHSSTRRQAQPSRAVKSHQEIACHHHNGLESLCPLKVTVPIGPVTEGTLRAHLPEGWVWKRLSVDFTLVVFCPQHRDQACLFGR